MFISHTAELREFPQGRSYVDEVERAVSATGHVIVDMADFPASDQPSAQLCVDRVAGCDVYVGILGTRYGSPVRDLPEVSYTELEFDTATRAELDRLVFLLDTEASGVGIPLSRLIDREYGDRQDDFRRRVRATGLSTRSFTSPADLGRLVERSLRELARTRRRMASGIQREQVPAEPQPVRGSKFVNPPPALAPVWFQDRQVETALLARYVNDPAIRVVTVTGRGGIGKTAVVCRLLKGFESGRLPDVDGESAEVTVGGIVYLSPNGTHTVEYPTLVADMLRLLPGDRSERLEGLYQNPHHRPSEMMLGLLEAFPVGDPVVLLLDNLESVMDTAEETLIEPALHEALSTVLTAPAHAVTVVTTTRVRPTALLRIEPGRQRQLQLDQGLGSPDAETVLRELDDDGRLGLRDAPDEVLDGLRRHTRGFPRALEAVKAILDGDDTLSPGDLLDRTRHLPEDLVVEVLVGEAYELLDPPAQQVMQALSVYPAPVSAVGVDFMLRPTNPTTDASPILTRLVRRQLVRFHDQHYHLHPVDRDYARGRIPAGSADDPPTAFTLTALQARAADFYAQIRTPRESWRTIDDVRPQLAEFELRCATGDYDTAATVLDDIDYSYLRMWGHYRTLVELRGRIHGRITDVNLVCSHLINLGNCHVALGGYRTAIDLYTQAQDIARDTGNRGIEGNSLNGLAACHYMLDDYRLSTDLYTRALDLARDTGDRPGESAALEGLGSCHIRQGHFQRAVQLHTEALEIARETDDRYGEGNALTGLGSCHLGMGYYQQAVDVLTLRLSIARELADRAGEGFALASLGNCAVGLSDFPRAIDLHNQALTIALDVGDRFGETYSLNSLGTCRVALGDCARAVDHHTGALTIARDIGDRFGEGNALTGLGICRAELGDHHQAIDLHTEALRIVRDIGDPGLENNALSSLGHCFRALGRYPRAIDLYTDALSVADRVDDRCGRFEPLDGLGCVHAELGDHRRAVDLHTEALAVARDKADRLGEAGALNHLGRSRCRTGDHTAAADLHSASLTIARAIGSPSSQAYALIGLGRASLEADAGRARTLLEQAVEAATGTDEVAPKAEAGAGLARVHLELGDPAEAHAAVAAVRSLPHPTGTPMILLLDGLALAELDRAADSAHTLTAALAAADALLALADRNVDAQQVRALALAGLAVTAGADPQPAVEAVGAVVRAATGAAGVVADTRTLLDRIAARATDPGLATALRRSSE